MPTRRARAAAACALVVVVALAHPPAPGAGQDATLDGFVVALDPGHNGRNWARPDVINRLVDAGTLRKPCDTTGAQTADGYTEAAFAWDVAQRLRRLLTAAGARVVLTRRSNAGVGPCITTRARIGNRARADVGLSIHADGGPGSGRGFHVIYPPAIPRYTADIAPASRRLALEIRAAYRRTGIPYASYVGRSGLSVRRDLGGLNLSDVPKVFVEAGNMRNARDAALLRSPSFRQRIAASLHAGIRAYLVR